VLGDRDSECGERNGRGRAKQSCEALGTKDVAQRGEGRNDEAAGKKAQDVLVVLSQKVARFGFENQLFEKIQDWRARC
jgi:hypothetical protein